MSTKAEIVKETMIKAFNQMASGCGNKKCLNLHCKADSKLPNQIATELVQLTKESPDQDLFKSAKFIFCEQIEEHCPLEQAEESQIIKVFSDPRAIGSAFFTDNFDKAREKSIGLKYPSFTKGQ